jgi:hypothetical protein
MIKHEMEPLVNIENELLILFNTAKQHENHDLCFRILAALNKTRPSTPPLTTLSNADIESLIDACTNARQNKR